MGAIYHIELRQGEKVALLFSPRLYEFKGKEGVTFENHNEGMASVHSLYADVMFCAALNHWTLTHSANEEFPYSRVEFHDYSATNRKSFEKCAIFAMECLSGKSIREIAESAQKSQDNGKESNQGEDPQKGVKKKSLRGLIMCLLKRS